MTEKLQTQLSELDRLFEQLNESKKQAHKEMNLFLEEVSHARKNNPRFA